MKWFEKAIHREKIIHLFNQELEVEDIYLHKIVCYDHTLTIFFFVVDLPKTIPQKWKKKDFNAISIRLSFFDVNDFNMSGKNCFNVNGKLDISFLEGQIKMSFNGTKTMLSCHSDFYAIDDIQPVSLSLDESAN